MRAAVVFTAPIIFQAQAEGTTTVPDAPNTGSSYTDATVGTEASEAPVYDECDYLLSTCDVEFDPETMYPRTAKGPLVKHCMETLPALEELLENEAVDLKTAVELLSKWHREEWSTASHISEGNDDDDDDDDDEDDETAADKWRRENEFGINVVMTSGLLGKENFAGYVPEPAGPLGGWIGLNDGYPLANNNWAQLATNPALGGDVATNAQKCYQWIQNNPAKVKMADWPVVKSQADYLLACAAKKEYQKDFPCKDDITKDWVNMGLTHTANMLRLAMNENPTDCTEDVAWGFMHMMYLRDEKLSDVDFFTMLADGAAIELDLCYCNHDRTREDDDDDAIAPIYDEESRLLKADHQTCFDFKSQ